MEKYLENIIKDYQNTKECHAQIHRNFLDAYHRRDYLVNHKGYSDHKIYGEETFHFLWELLVQEMPVEFNFLEIGVFKGQVISLIGLLMKKFQKRGNIVGASTFDGSGDIYSNYSKDIDYETITKETWNYFNPMSSEIKLHLIKGSSIDNTTFYQVAKLSPYDMVYIDGCHNYDVVVADIKHYAYMTKIGGFIIMDDASTDRNTDNWPGHPDVGKAVNMKMDANDSFEFLFAIGHIKVFRRRQ